MEKKEIKSRIDMLEYELSIDRATGRSTRIINQIIEDFFQKPIGTEIEIHDHWGTKQADWHLQSLVRNRLYFEYPGVKYSITPYPYKLIRKSETYKEILQKEIDELTEMLNFS